MLADANGPVAEVTSLTELAPIGATGFPTATQEAKPYVYDGLLPKNDFNWWLVVLVLMIAAFILLLVKVWREFGQKHD